MPLKMTELKFNPPKEEAKKLPRYASYAAGVMKTHGGIGFAKNSLNNRMWTWGPVQEETNSRQRVTTYAAILENVDGTWYTLYEIPAGSTGDELPWMDDAYYSYNQWNRVTDHFRESTYWQGRVARGEIKIQRRAFSMTTDEYVNWRIAVERERVATVMTTATFREKS